MPNYYTQFSEALVLDNAEQADWVRTQLDAEKLDRLREQASKHPTPTDKIKVPDWAKNLVLAEYILNGQDAYFSWEIEESDTPGKYHLALFAEEVGDIDAVIEFVQAFLKKFAPDHCFTLSWAATSSKMVAGEFGGGAAFVTADKVEYLDTSQWLSAKARTAGPQANVKA